MPDNKSMQIKKSLIWYYKSRNEVLKVEEMYQKQILKITERNKTKQTKWLVITVNLAVLLSVCQNGELKKQEKKKQTMHKREVYIIA